MQRDFYEREKKFSVPAWKKTRTPDFVGEAGNLVFECDHTPPQPQAGF